MIARRLRPLLLVALVAAGAVVASGCASTLNDAATVSYTDTTGHHTTHISRDTIEQQLREFVGTKAVRDTLSGNGFTQTGSATTDSRFAANWLGRRVQQTQVEAELKARHITPTAQQKAQAEQALQSPQNLGPTVYAALPKKLRELFINDLAEQIALTSSCRSGKMYERIVLRTEDAARSAFRQIQNGTPFAQVARTSSLDPASASNGGIVGCYDPSTVPPQIQQAVNALGTDAVSVPISAQGAYQLILLRDWDPQLAAQLQLPGDGISAYQKRLDPKVLTVRVDPRFGSWKQVQTQNGPAWTVVPPTAPTPRENR